MPDYIRDLRFCFDKRKREQFREGRLGPEWARRYPYLFDQDDVRIYGTQAQHGYHFFEWFAAVLFYESTGFRTLMEKYDCHPNKLRLFERFVPKEVCEFVCADSTGAPDLFVFDDYSTDWFFCEVKGPRDELRDHQLRFFRRLYDLTGKPVRVLTFEPIGL
jgi:hypothetical protein